MAESYWVAYFNTSACCHDQDAERKASRMADGSTDTGNFAEVVSSMLDPKFNHTRRTMSSKNRGPVR